MEKKLVHKSYNLNPYYQDTANKGDAKIKTMKVLDKTKENRQNQNNSTNETTNRGRNCKNNKSYNSKEIYRPVIPFTP